MPDPVLTDTAFRAGLTNEGGVDGTFRLLKNVMGLWLVQRCRAAFGAGADYEALTRQAAAAAPLRSLIDPDDPRFLNPPDMPAAIAGFCRETGQPVPETPGQFVRCCLESLALKYRAVLAGLAAVTGVPVEGVHVVGNGSRNRLLNQFTADATGLPIVAGPVEATALGNVLVQARAAGEVATLADLRAVVRESVEPEQYVPTGGDRWAEAAARMGTPGAGP